MLRAYSYSALTSSTGMLQALHIWLPMPRTTGHVRSYIRSFGFLPNLHVLRIGGEPLDEPNILSCVARACPNLRQLYMEDHSFLQCPKRQLPALKQLQQLRKLVLSAEFVQQPGVDAHAVWQSLAQLTQLEDLSLLMVQKVPAGCLQQLTALKGLTTLRWGSSFTWEPTYWHRPDKYVRLTNTVSLKHQHDTSGRRPP
jgi:hypothetical protein